MREIKFRCWNSEANKMHQLQRMNFVNGQLLFVGSNMPTQKEFKEYYTVMQYTGLTDKNGKEIYEGDIIKTFDYEATIHKIYAVDENGNNQGEINRYSTQKQIDVLKVVKWHKNSCSLTMGNIWPCDFSMEIVGNIYENPELI